jgi:hypothetical protein
VYVAVNAYKETVYVGRSSNYLARAVFWWKRNEWTTHRIADGLGYHEARALEEYVMCLNPHFTNRIHGISILASDYQYWMKWANDFAWRHDIPVRH